MTTHNLFQQLPRLEQGEEFETLLQHHNLKIERIVSSSSPEDTRYCQPQDEWVALLQGEAMLEVDGAEHRLRAGDHRFIPAGTPHRVLATSEEPRCIWLAVHLYPEPS